MDARVADFLNYMLSRRGASRNTVALYGSDLEQFCGFLIDASLSTDRLSWESVDQGTITEFILELRRKRNAEATIAHKVAALKSFFAFLRAEGELHRNPLEDLRIPRAGTTLPRPLPAEEVDSLLEQPAKRNTPEALRDRAMLEVLYATGMRVSELVSLDTNSIQIQDRRSVMRCLGKGAKERSIPIHDKAAGALQTYLDQARPRLVRNRIEPALFVNRRGKRLTRQGFWLLLRAYARQAGIQTPVTPHTLRHSFAVRLLRGGAPLGNVQELLGHARVATTVTMYGKPAPNTRRRSAT